MGWKLYVLALFIVVNVLIAAFDHYLKCDQGYIHRLCAGYEEGSVNGPLCYDLCVERHIAFEKCLTSDPDKQVFRGTFKTKEVVLKFSRHWFREFDVKKSFLAERDRSESYDAVILRAMQTKLGDSTRCKRISETLTSMADVDMDGQLTESELTSLLALVEQQEPVMLMALNGSKHSPRFFGYCGGLYAVEALPFVAGDFFGVSWAMKDLTLLPFVCEPLDEFIREVAALALDYISVLPHIADIFDHGMFSLKRIIYDTFFQIRKPTVQETVAFLLQLMDMLHEFSGRLGILQSCDAHISNFGITNNLTVKAIDFDLTFTNLVLSEIMTRKSCLSHEDCKVGSYDECSSLCNFETGFCSPQLYSQDLQYMCSTIFQLSYNFSDVHNIPPEASSCLGQGISRVVSFCAILPHAKTTEELHVNVKKVKSALKTVQKECLSDN